MRQFHHPLDPAETLRIRRVLTPPRVPNKGKAVYGFHPSLRPFLEENGWELVGYHTRDRLKAYFRSPGGVVANSFVIHASIPNDEAIYRLTDAMIRFARPAGPEDTVCFDGKLGHFYATFYGRGRRVLADGTWDYPGAEEARRRDRVPSLHVGLSEIWGTDLYWLDGYDDPPTWDRAEYFSAIVPGVSPRGELYSDLEITHATELKRYEESLARQSDKSVG
jgi:hypothetical protein